MFFALNLVYVSQKYGNFVGLSDEHMTLLFPNGVVQAKQQTMLTAMLVRCIIIILSSYPPILDV